MLLSAVSVLVVAQSSSEIPEGLMNNPVNNVDNQLDTQCLLFQATSRQHLGCIIPQAVTHSLVLLKMGEIIARNVLS